MCSVCAALVLLPKGQGLLVSSQAHTNMHLSMPAPSICGMMHQACTVVSLACTAPPAGVKGCYQAAKLRAVEGGFECFLASDASAVVEHTKK